VQRLLRRLDNVPVGVYDAAWTLVAWNQAWAALMGDPSAQRGRDRNLLWRYFTGQPGSRILRTEQQAADFEAETAADLRNAAARYPDDDDLRGLIADLNRSAPVSPSYGRPGQSRRIPPTVSASTIPGWAR
jgi:hypothetical protein